MSDKHKTPALFTPLFEPAIVKYGITTAAVYGEVWRYCQMPQGMCVAAKSTIAENLGLCLRTVVTCINVLCSGDEPYLEDITPDVRNRPHALVDTGQCRIDSEKAMQEMHTTVQEVHTESPQGMQAVHTTMQEMHTGMQNFPVRYAGIAQEESIKRDLKETIQDRPASLGEPPPPLAPKTITPDKIPRPDPAFAQTWKNNVLPVLETMVDGPTLGNWIQPIHPIAFEGGLAFLGVGDQYDQGWANRCYKQKIVDALACAFDDVAGYTFVPLPQPGGT